MNRISLDVNKTLSQLCIIPGDKKSAVCSNQKKLEIKRGLFYAVLLGLILAIILTMIFHFAQQSIHQQINRSEFKEISDMEDKIHDQMLMVDAYLFQIARYNISRQTLTGNDPIARKYSESVMLTISQYKKNYDQLRLLDKTGQEVVRVNYTTNGEAYVVPVHRLQLKEQRYYFQESIGIPADKIYMSAFDLNMEQGKIETPHKPMIRLARVVTDKQGNTIGLALINYLGQKIFDAVSSLTEHSGDQWYMINEQGYYLHGPRAENDFAFMFKHKKSSGLFSELPDFWSYMQTNVQGYWQNERGLYHFKHISPYPETNHTYSPVKWTLITFIPRKNIHQAEKTLKTIIGLTGGLFGPLLLYLGWILGVSQVRNRWYIKALSIQASQDELTGLLNRRAVLEQLEYLITLVKRNKEELSIVFVDVNDLKLTNDLQGHEAGDLMLKAAAAAFDSEIRSSDMAARIGGDEFLLVFPGCHPRKAELIMERVVYRFATAGINSTGSPWSMSWGSAYWQGEEDCLDDFINRADEKMYAMKKKIKGKVETGNDPASKHIPFPE